jgi:hypothetical protein
MIAPMRHQNNLDTAAPLGNRRGHRSPQTMLTLDERAGLLRETARLFFSGESAREAAHRLHQALIRYECGAWRRDRSELTCPQRHRGRIEAHLWRILKVAGRVPGEEAIRKIISPPGIRYPRDGGQCDWKT